MMTAFSVSLLCAVALAVGAREIGRRASPRLGSAALVAAALTVAVAADAALAVLIGARLLDVAPLAGLLGWRAERPGHIPVPVPVTVIAAGLLVFTAVRGAADWRSARRGWRRLHELPSDAPGTELIVMRSPAFVAHALPARRSSPGRIVVSDGLLSSLDAAERRVVLAHERSHLRNRHDRYRTLVRIAARINPLMRPAVAATDLLLERWADEDAARAVGSRRVAARALARAAITATAARSAPEPAGFAALAVSTRVQALLAPAPAAGSRTALVVLPALALTAAVSAGLATHDLAHLFDLLRGDG
ncbi:MAG: hypothetical protein QOK21_2435 [Solirubrobacteraceae bacterium]|jgi:Zn-dependent protease with chaperone function|nr:hypothetical protein [Solirubrobacteraceae bacterium]